MTPEPEPTLTVDELLAAYASDPASLTAAERTAVEARLAADPAAARELAEVREVLAEVRAHGDVADVGPDWAVLEARIRGAVVPAPAPARRRWAMSAGLALAAAAGLALWWQHRRADDGPGLGLATLIQALPAPAPTPAPAVLDDDAALGEAVALDDFDDDLDEGLEGLDDLDDAGALFDLAHGLDDLGGGALEDDALLGRALERVPAADDESLFPGLETEWLDELSEAEVEQALRWLDQQGAG